jgi:amidase
MYVTTHQKGQSQGCITHQPLASKDWEFKNVCIPRFIESFDECPISSVADIVRYNNENRETALPTRKSSSLLTPNILLMMRTAFTEQNDLEAAMNSTETKQNIDILKQDLRSTARQILDEAFDKQQVNLIAAPGDSPLCIHAAAAGIPLPLPYSCLLVKGLMVLTEV